ncbi:hypothetical protein FRC01_012447, partial [Tulasnella sp. 417]
MDGESKTVSMPTAPSTSIPTPTSPSAQTAGSKGSTIQPMSPISSGFVSPNRASGFPDLSQNASMPSPSLIGGDYPSQQVEFSPDLPSPLGESYRSPIGFVNHPPTRDHRPQPRNLILCFDGTAKYFNDGNTNVIRLFQGLDKMRTDKQLCYYQPGIGTYVSPTKSVGQISRRVSKAIDMAVAWYLDDHVMGGYRFLMENYREGDRICLFGFSRGAYTARCLAGMLHIVGLLPRSNEEQIQFAYSLYKDKSDDGVQKAHGFKKAFSRHVSIEFMGVWDSVTSVGLAGKTLPFTSHNAVVKTFRQAFALDERRAKFRHNPWARAAFDGPPPAAMPNPLNRLKTRRQSVNVGGSEQNQEPLTISGRVKLVGTAISMPGNAQIATSHGEKQTAEKCDVGGGEVNTFKEKHKNNLSNPSLLWMVQQIDASGVGILWAHDAFDDVPTVKAYFNAKRDSNLPKPSTSPTASSPTGTESKLPPPILDELKKDVKSKPHDSLRGITSWWLLEFIPLWKHFLDGNKQQCKEL